MEFNTNGLPPCNFFTGGSSSSSSLGDILNSSLNIRILDCQSLNGEGYIGSANPNLLNEALCFNGEDSNRKIPDFEVKRHLKGKRKSVKLSSKAKGRWNSEEDSQLIKLVTEYGDKNWSKLSKNTRRDGNQCRERWLNHLRPDVKKEKFTEEEDKVIVACHRRYGSKWTIIAQHLPGRSDNSIKNHFNLILKKVSKKHEDASSTHLEKYIRKYKFKASSADACFGFEHINQMLPIYESSGADFSGSRLLGPIIQTVDASSGLERNGQMLPTHDADVQFQATFEQEKEYSDMNCYVPMVNETNFAAKDESNAPYWEAFNLEDDALFLELAAGWK